MRIFEDKNGHLEELEGLEFKDEYELHKVVENNLEQFFPGLKKVAHEFPLEKGKRLDTLAYDPDESTFVIIEYKKKERMEMIEQVDSYKNAVQRQRAKCRIALVDNLKLHVDEDDIKWTKTRMIYVKPDFSKDEIEFALHHADPVDLCAVSKYRGGWLMHHIGNEDKPRSRKPKGVGHRLLSQTGVRRQPESGHETKHYSEQDWLDGKYGGPVIPRPTRNLYFALKKEILDTFPTITHMQQQKSAGFYLNQSKTRICSIICTKHKLDLIYATKSVDSLPLNHFVKDASRVGKYASGCHRSHLRRQSDVSRALEYVGAMHRQLPSNKEPKHHQPQQYSESDWLDGKYGGTSVSKSTRNLYFALKQGMIDMFPRIKYTQQKLYAKFYLEGGKTICTVGCTKDKLDLVYATNDMGLLPLNDFVEDVSEVGHHGSGKHRSRLLHKPDIPRALEYVGMLYNRLSSKKPDRRPPRNKPADKPEQYSEDDWLAGKHNTPAVTQQTRDLYFELKSAILDRFGRVEHKQKSKHAGFYIKGSANQVCSVICRKSLIYLMYGTKKKDLLPADDFITDMSNTGHWGAGDYRSTITAASDIQRALDYVDLVYRDLTAT